MPLLDDKLLVLLRKLLSTRKLTDLQSERFTQLDEWFNLEDCFSTTVSDMNMMLLFPLRFSPEAKIVT